MYKIITVAGGFYFFGKEVESDQEGFITIVEGSMFGGFSGGKGVAGVSRGDKEAKVTLDQFEKSEKLVFPISGVYAILPSIDLYKFKGSTLR